MELKKESTLDSWQGEPRLPWHRPRVERLQVNPGTALDNLEDGSNEDADLVVQKPITVYRNTG
jgi:hypothetical protein